MIARLGKLTVIRRNSWLPLMWPSDLEETRNNRLYPMHCLTLVSPSNPSSWLEGTTKCLIFSFIQVCLRQVIKLVQFQFISLPGMLKETRYGRSTSRALFHSGQITPNDHPLLVATRILPAMPATYKNCTRTLQNAHIAFTGHARRLWCVIVWFRCAVLILQDILIQLSPLRFRFRC